MNIDVLFTCKDNTKSCLINYNCQTNTVNLLVSRSFGKNKLYIAYLFLENRTGRSSSRKLIHTTIKYLYSSVCTSLSDFIFALQVARRCGNLRKPATPRPIKLEFAYDIRRNQFNCSSNWGVSLGGASRVNLQSPGGTGCVNSRSV